VLHSHDERVPRVLLVIGTRPEAIKVAPVIAALRDGPLEGVVVATAQHRDLLDQMLTVFGIVAADDLDVQQAGQTPDEIVARVLSRLPPVFERHRPDLVLVQGDTTTAFAAALAAFHAGIPVVHLEAGLRSGDLSAPWPEEMNRRLVGQLATLHLAPTASARQNLEHEGVDPDQIVVTGNTVIDALRSVLDRDLPWAVSSLGWLDDDPRRLVLVTVHRRESWGEPMAQIAEAVRDIVRSHPDVVVLLPLHPNPIVRDAVVPVLADEPGCVLIDPLPYTDFARVLRRSHLLLTDSGGLQEEGPSLGKPVLVLRDNTERPEGVAAGTARVVGTDPRRIVEEASRLLDDQSAYVAMANAVNPYGDGQAAGRVVQAMHHVLGLGPPAEPFAD
jgi:UDP-N-acetylglucosamine 2-epimerase (non-hydrolysing)